MENQIGNYDVNLENRRRPNWLSLASPLLGALGGVGQAIFSMRQQKKQNEANLAMSQMEFQQNKEMWELQNKYNSPAEQMKRLEEAGLSKQLMYGQGTVGNAQTLPRYQAPSMEYVKQLPELDLIGKYQNTRMSQAQLDLAGTHIDLNKAEKSRKILDYAFTQDVYDLRKDGIRTENSINKAKEIFTVQELETLFEKVSDGTKEHYLLRPSWVNTWVDYVDAKYKTGATQLEKYSTDIALAEARRKSTLSDVELKEFIPLLGKLIQFLQAIKGF